MGNEMRKRFTVQKGGALKRKAQGIVCSRCGSDMFKFIAHSLFEEEIRVMGGEHPAYEGAVDGSQEHIEVLGVRELVCDKCGAKQDDTTLRALANALGYPVKASKRSLLRTSQWTDLSKCPNPVTVLVMDYVAGHWTPIPGTEGGAGGVTSEALVRDAMDMYEIGKRRGHNPQWTESDVRAEISRLVSAGDIEKSQNPRFGELYHLTPQGEAKVPQYGFIPYFPEPGEKP